MLHMLRHTIIMLYLIMRTFSAASCASAWSRSSCVTPSKTAVALEEAEDEVEGEEPMAATLVAAARLAALAPAMRCRQE